MPMARETAVALALRLLERAGATTMQDDDGSENRAGICAAV